MSKRRNPFYIATEVVDFVEDTYDFVSSFAVATATTDYDLDAQQATAFNNVAKARTVVIWTDQDITVKLNATTNPAITIPAGESPFEFKNLIEITNIYITNVSGNTANIKVMLI